LQFYVALAERAERELGGPQRETWYVRLDAERENILLAFAQTRCAPGGGAAGLRLVHALLHWMVLREVELWLGVTLQALAHPGAQQADVARCRALYVAATMSTATGRPAEGYALAQSSAGIAVRAAMHSSWRSALSAGIRGLGTRPNGRRASSTCGDCTGAQSDNAR
jgi:hypothetical protein